MVSKTGCSVAHVRIVAIQRQTVDWLEDGLFLMDMILTRN